MKKIKFMFMLLAGLVLGACSSDSDSHGGGDDQTVTVTESTQSEAPEWKIDWSNDQEAPSWTEPTAIYENWKLLKIQLDDALQATASGDDLLGVFVNDELRGLAKPVTDLDGELISPVKFIVKISGNEAENETVNISLRYYSQTLRHLFTLTERIQLNYNHPVGIDEDYIVAFTEGSAKYPVVKTVSVEPLLKSQNVPYSTGDMVGAFVGDECRGTATLAPSGMTTMVVYGREAGEMVTLKVFDEDSARLFTITNAMEM